MAFARYIPSHEVDSRHRAARSTPRGAPLPIPKRGQDRNVQAVLSLGSTRYFLFRGRTYGVPPVSFQTGQRVLDLYVRSLTLSRDVASTGKADSTREYFTCLQRLSRLLWRSMRPIGKYRKILRRCGMLRNPLLMNATELELKDVADFFLQGRTKSSVQFPPELNPALETQMS